MTALAGMMGVASCDVCLQYITVALAFVFACCLHLFQLRRFQFDQVRCYPLKFLSSFSTLMVHELMQNLS